MAADPLTCRRKSLWSSALKIVIDGAETIWLGSPFHEATTLFEKKDFRKSKRTFL